jgi:uncharacterized protein (UPF0332 family)
VKPETAAYFQKSQEFLDKAQGMLAGQWPDEAGRAAYLAGFHAAQALLFESTGRTPKTHSGVQTEFARLIKDDERFDIAQRRFLGRAYNLKAVADYETGPASHVTPAQAQEAIDSAKRFVASVVTRIPAQIIEE